MFKLDFPSEKFIEDYLEYCMAAHAVCPIDDRNVDHFLRQHEIKGYGRTDLIKFYISPGLLEVVILELKNEILNELHLAQLARYLVGAKWQAKRYARRFPGYEIEVRGQLAGPFDPSANDLVWSLEQTQGIEAFSISLDMESGFRAEEIQKGWHKTNQDLRGAMPIAEELAPRIFALEEAMDEFEDCGKQVVQESI